MFHDKSRKPYQVCRRGGVGWGGWLLTGVQHRFIVTTLQGNAAQWAVGLATTLGYGQLADSVARLGSSFVGDYLHDF